MRKTNNLVLFLMAALVSLAVSSCGPQGDKAATGDAMAEGDAKGVVYQADNAASIIEWEGTKPGGSHNGTIGLLNGALTVDGDEVTGGEFVIDMKSIVCIDLTDPEYNAKLVGHLLSPDFFAVDSFPTARFKTTLIEKLDQPENGDNGMVYTHAITGNLTLKEVTRSVSFKAAIAVEQGVVKATTGRFTIDRSEWNVKYGSRKFFDNLKDKFIYDEIGLKISLTARQ